MNLAQLSMVSKENLPKKNLTRSGNLFWMHCKYTNIKIKQNILYVYLFDLLRHTELNNQIVRAVFINKSTKID